MTKRDFLSKIEEISVAYTDMFPELEERFQKARKKMIGKAKAKCKVYEDVIEILTNYVAALQDAVREYSVNDINIEDFDSTRVLFSMPIQ